MPDIIIIYPGRIKLYIHGTRLVDGQWEFAPNEMPATKYDEFTQDLTTNQGYQLEGSRESRFKGQKLASPVILYRGDLDQALAASKILHDAIIKQFTPDAAE